MSMLIAGQQSYATDAGYFLKLHQQIEARPADPAYYVANYNNMVWPTYVLLGEGDTDERAQAAQFLRGWITGKVGGEGGREGRGGRPWAGRQESEVRFAMGKCGSRIVRAGGLGRCEQRQGGGGLVRQQSSNGGGDIKGRSPACIC